MKEVIFYVSLNQSKEDDKDHTYELCSSSQIWAKAQTLSEKYTYSLGDNLYAFPNVRFFDQKFEEITKPILEHHLCANKYSKGLEEYKRRCLWVYDHRKKVF